MVRRIVIAIPVVFLALLVFQPGEAQAGKYQVQFCNATDNNNTNGGGSSAASPDGNGSTANAANVVCDPTVASPFSASSTYGMGTKQITGAIASGKSWGWSWSAPAGTKLTAFSASMNNGRVGQSTKMCAVITRSDGTYKRVCVDTAGSGDTNYISSCTVGSSSGATPTSGVTGCQFTIPAAEFSSYTVTGVWIGLVCTASTGNTCALGTSQQFVRVRGQDAVVSETTAPSLASVTGDVYSTRNTALGYTVLPTPTSGRVKCENAATSDCGSYALLSSEASDAGAGAGALYYENSANGGSSFTSPKLVADVSGNTTIASSPYDNYTRNNACGSSLTFTSDCAGSVSVGPRIAITEANGFNLNGSNITRMCAYDYDYSNIVLGLGSGPTCGDGASAGARRSFTLDNQRPSLSSWSGGFSANTSSTSSTYTLNFSEPVAGLASGDLSNAGSLSSGSCTFGTPSATSPTSGYSDTWTVGVSCSSPNGTFQPRLASSSVNDSSSTYDSATSALSRGTYDGTGWSGPTSTSTASSSSIDTTAPTLTLEQAAGQSDPTSSAPVQFTLSGDENLDTATITSADFTITNGTFASKSGSGSSYTINVTPSGQGAVSIAPSGSFSVSDEVGNSATSAGGADRSVTYDTAAPTATWSGTPSSPNKNTSVQYTLNFSESVTGVADGDFSNASSAGAATGCSFSVSGSGSGPYTLTVNDCSEGKLQPRFASGGATDSAGNTGPASSADATEITLDRTAPSAPTLGNTYTDTNDNTPTWSFTGAEAGGSFECKMDSGSYASCSSPYTASPALSDGSHTFYVRQIDDAGNVGAVAVDNVAIDDFNVDTSAPDAPSITPVSPDPTNDTTPSISFTGAEGGGTYQCKMDGDAYATCSSPYTPSALSDGSHTVYVRQIDAAGNTGSASTDTFSVDATAPAAPTLTTTPNDPTSDTTPTFEWTGAEGGGTYECKVDSGSYSACSSPYTHSALADGSHTFYVRQVDSASNNGAAETFTWSVSTSGPSAPSIDSGPNGVTGSTTATFTFSGVGGATFECKIGSSAWGACTSPKEYTSLVDGHYTFRVRQTSTGLTSDPTVRNFVVDTDGYDSSDTSSAVNRQQFLSLEVNPTIEVQAVGSDYDIGAPQPGGLRDTAEFAATVNLRSNLSWTSAADASNFSNMSIPIVVIGDGDTGPSNGGAGVGDGTQSYEVTFQQEISWADDATPELAPNDASVDHTVSNSL